MGGPAKTRCSLLIVDDEVLVLRALSRVLCQEYDLTTFSSPEEALICLSRGSWDIILSDVMMPEMDGVEFARRAVEARPELAGRIVLMTGGGPTLKTRTALAHSGLSVVAKPVDLDALLALLAKVSSGQA